ncbi:hypothetical protein A3E39_00680 [Candidatus Uhrbacteria bacterium RIFCSPHIGHO2_12_FULL_60_25]|uniref:Uncharacterized protein n=1 Tax=Candidatus Uhrbacteria bacterium RIFCSPHIGHO2_12_FULL_60_25 TaxID=1802399 RepID=A0A1F7UN13_9BACT|nr:MAG: hypothetical protein A3D73_03290 [Candidatus Uhrbacteria bacterium RIFCSPHIGHO2_02_FULL_60_44]OGL79625.1 MAG: hypothetical protein A3E39_00680 [Candidatus Uhrbacteria bacterium RIFCSPHIGHO2_12_FULL_60_25]
MENITSNISSRFDARLAIQKAVAKMPRTSSLEVTASGGTRASFRPDIKSRPVATETATPETSVDRPTVADLSPQTAQSPSRTHRYPTAERVTQLLVGGVKRNLDRAMGRPQALDAARTWIVETVLAKNEGVKDEDRAARTDQVKNLDVVAFWAAFDAVRADCVRPDQATVAHTSESLLAALAGADQVTTGDVLEISDEPEITVVQKPAPRAKSTKTAPRPQAERRPQRRSLERLPLTTPGHLDDVVALFIERNVENGMPADRALSSACGRMFREIETYTTLSPEDVESLKRQVRAKLPKRGPAPAPVPVPFTVWGQIDREIDLHTKRNEEERGLSHDDALRSAVGLVWCQVDEDPTLSTDEREECIRLCQARLPAREEATHRASRGMEFLDRACPIREPKQTSGKPLTREEQEARAAEKKADRKARAEKSAEKSQARGECEMHTIAATKPKKEKKSKGNRGERAEA